MPVSHPSSHNRSSVYRIIIVFFLLALFVVCQLFQVYFSTWFTPQAGTPFFLAESENVFSQNTWFAVLMRQITSLSLETIKLIYFIVIIVLLVFLLALFLATNDKAFILFFGIILVGGLSNLISRLRTTETVVKDYFGFHFGSTWKPIFFNLEDALIGFGVLNGLLYFPLWMFWRGRKTAKTPVAQSK